MSLRDIGIIATFKKLYGVFSTAQRVRFHKLAAITFLGSVTDLFGLGMLIPVVGLVLSTEFYNNTVSIMPWLSGFGQHSLLLMAIGAFVVLMLCKNFFSLYISKRQVSFVQEVYRQMAHNLIRNIYNRPLPILQQATSHHIINTASYLPQALTTSALLPMLIIYNEAMVLALTIIIIAVWNWQLLLLLSAVLLPGYLLFYKKVKNEIRKNSEERSRNVVALNGLVQQMVHGYTDIKVAGTDDNFKKEYDKYARSFSHYQGRNDFLVLVPARIVELSIFICALAVLLYGVFVLKDAGRIIATVSLFSVIAYRIAPSANRIASALHNINSTQFILQDEQFMADVRSYADPAQRPLMYERRIAFEQVSFKYDDGAQVLNNCDLEIKRGECLGIIGSSGAGKSTLIKLLLGYLQPQKGNIIIDKTVLQPEHTLAWWQVLGYVRQDVFIANTTIAENIALGVPADKIDRTRLSHAIRLASLTELVKSKTGGVDALLGEGGNNLSGGQRQRIASVLFIKAPRC
jgi:ATP-binding cassette, subfamily B, bacterial PglK